jgi:Flp pilus assembly protein TadG
MNGQEPAQGRGRRFWRNRAGNVAPMFALMLVPMLALMGMAGEGSSWFLTQRSAQNTADQAALAAATNTCASANSCGTTYDQEAAGVARKYNFVNGAKETTVATDIATAPPPCDASTCYRVTIQRNVPIYLIRVLGFAGNASTATGQAATNISASAIAARVKSDSEFCITTLSNDPQSFRVNGGPALDLSSCTVFAPNGGAVCNGISGPHVQGAYVNTAGNSSSNCGVEQVNPLPLLDPYDALKSNLTNPCGTAALPYWNATKKNPTPPAANRLTGPKSSATICGDAVLTGDVTFAANSVLVIENGHLDLAGHTLSGPSLTIVFSGTAAANVDHFVTGSGTLDYSAPDSGTWSGIAMYQDPRLPSGNPVDFTYSGNTPDFNITGMIYAPRANVTLDGAIDHATQGLACLTFFVNNMTVNGTASIFATPTIKCPEAGLNPDDVQTLQKVVLVQ